MFSTCPSVLPSVRPSVRLFVRLLATCERYSDIFKTNEPILMQPGSSVPEATVDLGDQQVKDQGHRRLKLDLEAWRRHHSRPLESSRQRHTMSNGNVAFERGCCT